VADERSAASAGGSISPSHHLILDRTPHAPSRIELMLQYGTLTIKHFVECELETAA
jgi:hypothetical protein